MELLRKYFWWWVVFGMVFMSVVISIVFLFICKCLSRKGKHRISPLEREPNFKIESNKYEERNTEAGNPPLPPRTQFHVAESQSYENLAETPEEEEDSIHDYEEAVVNNNVQNAGNCNPNTDLQGDYVKPDEGETLLHPPCNSMKGGVSQGESYENLAEEHDYEESTDLQPDYVKMEEEETFPPPPYNGVEGGVSEAQSYENLAKEHDYEESTDNQPDYIQMEDEAHNGSESDYDDIDGEDNIDEDYDDVA